MQLPMLPCSEQKDNDGLVLLSYLLHCLGIESKWNERTKSSLKVTDPARYLAFLYTTEMAIQTEFLRYDCGLLKLKCL